MGFIEHKDVQAVGLRSQEGRGSKGRAAVAGTGSDPSTALDRSYEPWTFRTFLRELNTRLRETAQVVNINRRESFSAQVYYSTVQGNTTEPIWIAGEGWQISSLYVVGSVAGGTVTLQINGVAASAALPITTTATEQFPTVPDVSLASLDVLGLVTAGLAGNAITCITVNLRRID